jgi:predicted SprT family Zn-dependent metalloprotease
MIKIFLAGAISFTMFGLVYRDYKSYQKKDNEFKKFINDVKQLENNSYMTRKLADDVLEAHE